MTTPIKTVTIQAWGNSQGIRLTRDMLRAIGINDPTGAELDIEVVDGELRLSPSQTPYERLMKKGGTLPERNRKFTWESPQPDEPVQEPTPRLRVTPEQQEAIYDYLDSIHHNKTLFMKTHQRVVGREGWTNKQTSLNTLSVDDLGKALFVGMISITETEAL